MPDLMETAQEWLAARLTEDLGTSVVYRRSSNNVTLSAVLGPETLPVVDALGNVQIKRPTREFSFAAADLILGGSQVAPADGDTIDLTIGSTTERYELTPEEGLASWEYLDGHKLMIRVRTKKTRTV